MNLFFLKKKVAQINLVKKFLRTIGLRKSKDGVLGESFRPPPHLKPSHSPPHLTLSRGRVNSNYAIEQCIKFK